MQQYFAVQDLGETLFLVLFCADCRRLFTAGALCDFI
jgi:hypothetical protein